MYYIFLICYLFLWPRYYYCLIIPDCSPNYKMFLYCNFCCKSGYSIFFLILFLEIFIYSLYFCSIFLFWILIFLCIYYLLTIYFLRFLYNLDFLFFKNYRTVTIPVLILTWSIYIFFSLNNCLFWYRESRLFCLLYLNLFFSVNKELIIFVIFFDSFFIHSLYFYFLLWDSCLYRLFLSK